jgi:Tat protein translocase TatB subunit
MFGLGFWELAVIFLVAFLVLGPKKLPELAKSIGKGLRDLRRASADLRSSVEEPLDELRKPLQELRDDLTDTVYTIREQVEREASELPAVEGQGVLAEGDAEGEIEDRRREVEELYAAAGEEDAAAGCDARDGAAADAYDPDEPTPCDDALTGGDVTKESVAPPEPDPGGALDSDGTGETRQR